MNLLVILGKVYIYSCRNDNSKLDLYVETLYLIRIFLSKEKEQDDKAS